MLYFYVIAFLSLLFLIVFHEFFHFIFAKRYGLKVREFGIGYPPRIFSFYFWGTKFSIGGLPFGGYVSIEEEELERASFKEKLVIVLAGIISFWVVSFLLLVVSLSIGISQYSLEKTNPKDPLTVVRVLPGSPAQKAGLEEGDKILFVRTERGDTMEFSKVEHFIDYVKDKEKVRLGILREGELKEVEVFPEKKENKRIIGAVLLFKTQKKFQVLKSFPEAMRIQISLAKELGEVLSSPQRLKGAAEITGPVGVFYLLSLSLREGLSNFLFFLGLLSYNLFLVNSLPLLPITDGGRAVRIILGRIFSFSLKPHHREVLELFFFFLLLGIMVIVTIKDIQTLF